MRLNFRKMVCGPLTVALVVMLGSWGCGPLDELPAPPALEEQAQALSSVNGFSVNGFSVNGFSVNGFSVNGFSVNGFSVNGLTTRGLTSATLSSEEFAAWFAQDPAMAAHVMHYVVLCAVPSGQTRSYTDPQTGKSYTWSGGLGLTPRWASGAAANPTEQEVITACLLAHVNRYGQNIPISVLGQDAEWNPLPFTHDELQTYSVREACFFGNLFTHEGLFFAVDRLIDDAANLTRACARVSDSGSEADGCAPLTFVGHCSTHCLPLPPGLSGPSYRTCMYNGKSYRALTTRMRPSDFEQLFPDD
ncbi:MAG: hypothetical protein JXB05_26420 [Myxococcaceae bacterium]|nr:hypothetical protein [Myxococcaceae bacterium]